jgi:hypothetical protein
LWTLFWLRRPGLKLPRHDSPHDPTNLFNEHFCKKVCDRTDLLASRRCYPLANVPLRVPPFSFFHKVTASEIVSLVMSSPLKSFLCDPIPTSLLRKCIDYLAVPILNLSLSCGVFPDEIKLALVTPLLKKPSLCPNDLNNYRFCFLIEVRWACVV